MKYNLHLLISVFISIAGLCYQVTRAQNYTTPNITDRTCTSVTVSSTVFSSTVLPWAFDWRINDGTDTTTLVSVTIFSENKPFIITPGPDGSPYSKRYNISNTPNPINSTSTPFSSTVTIELLKGECLSLSVPGLKSTCLMRPVCALKDVDPYYTSTINCETNPCTYQSEVNLKCSNGRELKTTCGCDGSLLEKCKTISDGEIFGAATAIATLAALFAVAIWAAIIKKLRCKTISDGRIFSTAKAIATLAALFAVAICFAIINKSRGNTISDGRIFGIAIASVLVAALSAIAICFAIKKILRGTTISDGRIFGIAIASALVAALSAIAICFAIKKILRDECLPDGQSAGKAVDGTVAVPTDVEIENSTKHMYREFKPAEIASSVKNANEREQEWRSVEAIDEPGDDKPSENTKQDQEKEQLQQDETTIPPALVTNPYENETLQG